MSQRKVFVFFFNIYIKGCHVWPHGCCQPVLAFFFFILDGVMQVLHGGRLTVNHLFSVFSEWEEAGEN